MPIKVTCPKCQGVLHAPDDAGGKRGKCPTCGTVLAIPAQTGMAAEPESMIPPEPHRSTHETPFKSPAMNRPPSAEVGRGSSTSDDARRSSSFGMVPDAASTHDARRAAPGRLPPPGFGSPEVRKPADPFTKPNKAAKGNSLDGQSRAWRRSRRGLLWVQFAYFLFLIAILAISGLLIASHFGVKLPDKTPGYAQQAEISSVKEIFAAAGLVPLILGLLCLTLGRFGTANAPRTSYAKGLLLASALATLLTVGGLIAYAAMTGEQIRTSGLMPPAMLMADEPVGMIQRGGLALAAVCAPVAELLFVIGLGRIGASLHHSRLAGRGTRVLLLAAFAFIVFGLGAYAHSLYSSDINRLIAEHVTPNINKAGEHKAIIVPVIAIAVGLVIWFVYVRLVGSGRQAIRQWLDENEPA